MGTQWEDREGQTVEITATDLELAAPNGTVPGIEVTTTTIDQDGYEGKDSPLLWQRYWLGERSD